MEAQSWVSEVADAVKREVNQVPGTLKRMAAGGIRVPFYVIYRTLRATVNNDNPPEEDHVVALFSIMEKQDEMYIPVMNGLNIRLMFAESWRVALKIMAIIHRMVSAEFTLQNLIDLSQNDTKFLCPLRALKVYSMHDGAFFLNLVIQGAVFLNLATHMSIVPQGSDIEEHCFLIQ